MTKRIFLLDDDPLILESFEMIFTDLGYEVTTCADPARAVVEASRPEFDLVLTDIRMPGLNGSEVVRQVLGRRADTPLWVLTAYPGDPLVQRALDEGARGVMKKPFNTAQILTLLED